MASSTQSAWCEMLNCIAASASWWPHRQEQAGRVPCSLVLTKGRRNLLRTSCTSAGSLRSTWLARRVAATTPVAEACAASHAMLGHGPRASSRTHDAITNLDQSRNTVALRVNLSRPSESLHGAHVPRWHAHMNSVQQRIVRALQLNTLLQCDCYHMQRITRLCVSKHTTAWRAAPLTI